MKSVSELTREFEQYLASNLLKKEPSELYEPVNYILQLGGKRMRPVLVLMACQLFGREISSALPAALAIEIFHNFTLVHDDIMDDAPLRRGEPTVHDLYDVNTAILSGDVMPIYAYVYLSKIDPDLFPGILEIFNQMSIEVCEGQEYDMAFETNKSVSEKEYLRMIELKTSVLLSGAMQIGALIGGASKSDAEQLAGFARNIGMAFQMQDDILDSFGDPTKFGKKPGGDIIQNKKTYLVIKARELADSETKSELEHWFGLKSVQDENEKISAVKSIFKKLGVRKHAEQMKSKYLKAAHLHLNKISVNDARKDNLMQFADQLMNRQS